jgi:D-serine deaminase-like pyridoxal phosphate-dependent protein
MLEPIEYEVKDDDQLITPCLLVYPQRIRSNVQAMIDLSGDVASLRPHVKTHKTAEIVALQQAMGISKFKCATLREAEMLGECQAEDVLIAYPQVGPAIQMLVKLVRSYPRTRFSTVVDNMQAAQALERELVSEEMSMDVFMDIDNGMHRTGIPAGEAAEQLYAYVCNSERLDAAGLHVYDGQNHQPSREERQAAVEELMQPIREMVGRLSKSGHAVRKLVCGGTPTFPVFVDYNKQQIDAAFEYSPGTCVLSDYNYGKDYPDISGIRHAAILMTRVISKQPGENRFTLDLGNKAVAADPPAGKRCHLLSLPGAREMKQNEEHLIVECDDASDVHVGDVHYVIPAHICPTVALHRYLQVVENGRLVDTWEVVARDRIYRV